MKGIEWGLLYNKKYRDKKFNPAELEERIKILMADYDVSRKAGIYEYIFDGEERHLNIRKIPDRDKMSAYERQEGICPVC